MKFNYRANKYLIVFIIFSAYLIIINTNKKKKKILVIDLSIPTFDTNAGNRCTFMYLKLLKELGFNVTFFAADFINREPYTSILQKNEIEVLYGDYYKKNITIWLKDNIKHYNFVYLQRPEVADKYLDIIKEHYKGKIIYFGHDLHYLRLLRKSKLINNTSIKNESEIVQKQEMEIFSKVDVIHVVGNYEEKILKDIFLHKPIRNIPIYIYYKQLSNVEKDFSKRHGIIYIGNFRHPPNIDAILWFIKDIFPLIIKKFPDIILHIVGSYIPIELKKLENKNIKFEKYLSDDNLRILYGKCRIAIAPLRYGAGVKGKLVEAAYNQIPMITTSIGGEGLDSSIGSFIIENDPNKMANLISDLYINFSKLKQMSDSGKVFIEKYFSFKRAKEQLMKDLN